VHEVFPLAYLPQKIHFPSARHARFCIAFLSKQV
jgi:hypothetical protein